ncbi:MAG: phosphoribosylformylglycinamidine synthase subunit PurL [Candidatus Bipolaricaulia bacterium]
MPEPILELKNLSGQKVEELLKKYNINLTVEEARKIEEDILGRPMTLTEATAWSIEGSEHCSYRSSKMHLKQLPTDAPNVMLGPEEDAGIVEIARYNGKRYGIVIAHESHNHPSQIVPYEGAATGIGGIVRDVCCMGAKVIAVADPLRFGGIDLNKSKWIAHGVISGIGGYGNPIGVPNIAGDVYFNSSFNENCLVNVIALGLVNGSGIIHSKAPQGAGEGEYDIILVGKPTDNSGFGGVSFASVELDKNAKQKNKGAVQEPNAFLKRHLLESSYHLFKILQKKQLTDKVGLKDLGGGGILCASVEMVDAGGYGAEIDLDKVHLSMDDLAPQAILCAETQERFMWIAPPEITKMIVDHYNRTWGLPKVSKGAQASVIGQVKTGGQYVVKYQGVEKVVDARACDITKGLQYNRPYRAPKVHVVEPRLPEPKDYNEVLLKVLAHENVADRSLVYERYDKTVQGITVIEPGQADAGVIRPLIDEDVPKGIKNVGVALAVDSNPFYARISPYWGAVNAVVEAMRNVAAVGAIPWAITDCLNCGNPEKPQQMWQFLEGVRGIADACNNIHLKGDLDSPVPVISGNVSFYNESNSKAIDPSAIIACLGRLDDYRRVITMELKQAGSRLYLIGPRKDRLGGSVYYQLFDKIGADVPKPNFQEVEANIYAVVDAINQGLLLSCHDISDGGLAVTLAEMCFGSNGKNRIGISVDLTHVSPELPAWKKLFSETGGFVLETKQSEKVKQICSRYGVELIPIGTTVSQETFRITGGGRAIVHLDIRIMAKTWLNGLRDKLS